MDERRQRPLLRVEISVARAHRQAVRLANGRVADDLQRQIEVANHLPDDAKLLVILLAEHREIGSDLCEQLATHRCHTLEEVRPRDAFEALGSPPRDDVGGESGRVHFCNIGHPHNVTVDFGEFGEVAFLLARVAGEVFLRRELGRVDEDGNHRPLGLRLGRFHQRDMASVQCTHGRHEADLFTGAVPVPHNGAQRRKGAHDLYTLRRQWNFPNTVTGFVAARNLGLSVAFVKAHIIFG